MSQVFHIESYNQRTGLAKSPARDAQMESLVDMSLYLEKQRMAQPVREQQFYEMIGQTIYTWPDYYLPRLDELVPWLEAQREKAPAWAIAVARKIVADIRSGATTNQP